jgi:minor histocompatibility antigen H13
MFLGKFETGFIMLILLFFYDIFFVFGTDVMLTVAKSVDAPIKILFPKNWTADPPELSLLGLGDIVLPGVFVALCLRYDVLKTLNLELIQSIGQREGQKKEKEGTLEKILNAKAMNASKTYFYGCLVGYMVAIVCTVVVMIIFDHGQPALLYLVPGCLLSVCFNAWRQKEFKDMWLHDEMEFISKEEEEETEDEKKKEK